MSNMISLQHGNEDTELYYC